ncbi:MAG: hypothetical protein ACREQQ_15705, partial [Candidatus Binatia bacterium]
GGEALLLGGTRPTEDIDFGLEVDEGFWPEIEKAVAEASQDVDIPVQYSQDIDRWSPIAIPAHRRKTRRLRRLGRLSVHLLDPACWAVYKLARYLESDVEDLRAVLKRERVSATRLARLCGESLRASPRSPALFAFRRQVEHFLREHGRFVWGKNFDPERVITAFHRALR